MFGTLKIMSVMEGEVVYSEQGDKKELFNDAVAQYDERQLLQQNLRLIINFRSKRVYNIQD